MEMTVAEILEMLGRIAVGLFIGWGIVIIGGLIWMWIEAPLPPRKRDRKMYRVERTKQKR